MLYDPKWDRLYSTANLAAWLALQPKRKTYDYTDPSNCAVAQYLAAHGVDPRISVARLRELDWNRIVNNRDKTFGGAARRARLVLGNNWRTRIAEYLLIVSPRDWDLKYLAR